MEEAREQGWLGEARLVSDTSAVIRFIKKHGGKYKISAGNDCTFVLGGSHDDPKVVTYVRAIENARSQTQGKRSKTKKAQDLEKIAQNDGVLRWTYVYSLAHRWISAGHASEESIEATNPEFLRPTALDFLVRPCWPGTTADVDPGLFEADLSTVSQMRRAIGLVDEVQRRRLLVNYLDESSRRLNWRMDCIEHLEDDKRWVVACKRQPLWPYNRRAEPQTRTVLYPDIFGDGCGELSDGQMENDNSDDRWKHVSPDLQSSWISAALPLVRVMGGFVASHLHDGVTHILCDLADGKDEIIVGDSTADSVFSDSRRGRTIMDRLHKLDEISLQDRVVILVSPRWVRKRKWCSDGEAG